MCNDEKNVYIESFVLHSRTLIEFLTNEKKKKKDDILAIDYNTITGSWKIALDENDKLIKDIKERADKELAHLTLKRKSGQSDEKLWDYEIIRNLLNEVISLFINDLDKYYDKENWKRRCELLQSEKYQF